MDERHLDSITRLDLELPVVDPELRRLNDQLRDLVRDAADRAALIEGYRGAILRWNADTLASNLPLDVDELFRVVHASVPVGTDPSVVRVLDRFLARLIEVGANIAGGDSPIA